MLEHVDFILRISEEALQGCGEDSWCYSFTDSAGMIAVLDGCGGSGAKKHAFYSGHSEAFMASRMGAGALYNAFQDCAEDPALNAGAILSRFESYCRSSFSAYKPPVDPNSRLRSSMITTLPTTLAAALLQPQKGGVALTAAWAGDSRVYLLAQTGLHQLSVDDSDDADPFETDGTMTNSLNADRKPEIRVNRRGFRLPALVLTATDGCFAYFKSPMEFEGVLLSTLAAASSAAAWERLLRERIGELAGDDYTLVLCSLGFGDFQSLQQALAPRTRLLRERWLAAIEALPEEDEGQRRLLWNDYRNEYCKYIKG